MANLALADIVSTGLQKAGVSSTITPFVKTEFASWLRSRYTDWPWPFLQTRYSGLALSIGVPSILFGAGAGTTLEVHRVFDPIWLYDSAYSFRAKGRIRTLLDGDINRDETVNNPVTNHGVPLNFKVRKSSTVRGQWSLVPECVPDRALLLAIDYWAIPADLTDTDIPIYPNELTLIKACEVIGLHHRKAENYDGERSVLAGMVLDDRIKFGEATGINQEWGLDPNTFK